MPEKLCTKCGQPGTFYRDRSRADGLAGTCKKCRNAAHTAYVASHRDDINKAYRERYYEPGKKLAEVARRALERPETVRRQRRAMALKRHNLTEERFQELLAEQGGLCAICTTDKPVDYLRRARTAARLRAA